MLALARTRPTVRELRGYISQLLTIKILFGWDDHLPHRSSATSWLDGLRGVAAVQVFFFHFFGRWTKWGNPWGATPEDRYIHQLVIFRPIWAGGSGAVSVFFVISGYVITYKCLNLIRAQDLEGIFKSLSSSFFRRGFRLFLPLIMLAIPTLVLTRYLDLSDGFLFPQERKETWQLQIQHFYNATDEHLNPLAYKDNSYKNINDQNNRYAYVPTSWTIPMEYYGSLACYLMILAISRVHNFSNRAFIICFMAFYSAHRGCWWVSNFLVGMLIADWTIEKKGRKARHFDDPDGRRRRHRILKDGFYFLLFAFGVYVSGAPPKNMSFDFAPVPRVGYEWMYEMTPPFTLFRFVEPIRWWWALCGNLIVLGISQVSWLQNIFTSRFCQWLGKLSFALYLVHALIVSTMSKPLNEILMPFTENKVVLCFLHFCIQTPMVLILSTAVERYIDRPSVRFAKWIEGKAFQAGERLESRDVLEARDRREMVALIPPV